jgi:hypothetical protein
MNILDHDEKLQLYNHKLKQHNMHVRGEEN